MNRILYVGNPVDVKTNYITFTSFESAIREVESMDIVGVDTETTGLSFLNDKIILIQIGNKETQVVFEFDYLTLDNLRRLKKFLENPDVLQIYANAKFDLKFFYMINVFPKRVFDVQLAERVIYHGLEIESVSLKTLVNKYCKVDLNKEDVSIFIKNKKINEAAIFYAANDVIYLEDILNKQLQLAKATDVDRHIELENDFVRVLAYVEYSGIYLNKEKWLSKIKESEANLLKTEDSLNQAAIEYLKTKMVVTWHRDMYSGRIVTNINWRSSKQVIKIFNALGFDLSYDDNGKVRDSLNSEVIDKIKDSHPILSLFSDFQKWSKDVSTYGLKMLNHIEEKTGRIHPNFVQILSTGRLSVNSPNIQNIPKENGNRECFTHQFDNTTLIDADYSAQEDKVFVNFTKEPKLIDFYLNSPNADGHSYVAKSCFPEELGHMNLEEVKRLRPDLRQKSKSAKFAIHYGGDGYTVARNLNIPIEQGKAIVNSYFKAFSGIKQYFVKVHKEAIEKGFIEIDPITGFKYFLDIVDDSFQERMRKINDKSFMNSVYDLERTNPAKFREIMGDIKSFRKQSHDIYKMSLNYPIQGSSASLTKKAGILFFNWILEEGYVNKVKIPNLVHDEILVECEKDIVDLVKSKLAFFMAEAAKPYCPIVSLEANPVECTYWTH